MTIVISTSNGSVGVVNAATGGFSKSVDGLPSLTDIAVSNDGRVFAITFSSVYSINLNSGSFTYLENLPANSFSALGFSANNRLFAISENKFYEINTNTGNSNFISNLNFNSSGDLIFDSNNNRFLATGEGVNTDDLYEIVFDPLTNTVVRNNKIGNIGFDNVFGLAFEGNNLLGYTANDQEIIINSQTGAGTFNKNIGNVDGNIWGASNLPDSQVTDPLLPNATYRFYNPTSRGHFFTTNTAERDNILANPQLGYQFEGVGFYSSATSGDNLLPAYRFYNPTSRGHFFTTNTAERDNILAQPDLGYQFEGIGFYVYDSKANLGADVSRFYNPTSRGHFFTTNTAERDSILAQPELGYQFEGVGFEASL